MSQRKIARNFYNKLGASGLASLVNEKHTAGYLRFLKKILPKHGHILDLACGYGRLTIPLAKAGYNIEGIDLASNLVREARKQTKAHKLNISFSIGSMLKLPYADKTFDAVMCMWSSFNELLKQTDQIKALTEMVRITKKGGLILIDLPFIAKSKINSSVITETIGGLEHTFYAHAPTTLNNLLQRASVKNFTIAVRIIGGRKRLVVMNTLKSIGVL